jgi:predicted anti-sigma-YlaC factor YlaD
VSEHVTEWLNAYVDAELRGNLLVQVEKHLAECRSCRAEMESLRQLSSLLGEILVPKFSSPERFAAQMKLRLLHGLPKSTKLKVQEVGWWMIPVSLLIIWVFISTAVMVNNVISTAGAWGLVKSAPAWLAASSFNGAAWSGRLAEAGLLYGNSLKWAEEMEVFTRHILHPIVWQVSIALLYLDWIAIWWVRYRQPGNARPLGG